jgi:hypothetical protein
MGTVQRKGSKVEMRNVIWSSLSNLNFANMNEGVGREFRLHCVLLVISTIYLPNGTPKLNGLPISSSIVNCNS